MLNTQLVIGSATNPKSRSNSCHEFEDHVTERDVFHDWFVNLWQSTFPEQVSLNVVHFWLQQIGGDNAQGKVIPQVSLYENWFAVDVLERQNNPQKAKFGLGRSKILNVNFRKKSQKPARELAQAQCHLLSIPLPPG